MLESNTDSRRSIAYAAAKWWADNLSPAHGAPFLGKEGSPFGPDEVIRFKEALASEIFNSLCEYPDPAAVAWIETLRVDGMIHTGILADAAEQTDLTGIIFHLPRCYMTLQPERGLVIVDDEVVWSYD